MAIRSDFWLANSGEPALLEDLSTAGLRLSQTVPRPLVEILKLSNGGVPRRRAWCPPGARRAWLVDQILALDGMETAQEPYSALVFATGEGGDYLVTTGNRVLHRGARLTDLGVLLADFLEGLVYDDARWLIGIRNPAEQNALLETLRRITGGIFQRESENEEGFRAHHGSLADTESPGRPARLYIYPNRGDYPEAPDCPWILEAAIRLEQSEEWARSLEGHSDFEIVLIHRPPAALVIAHTDMTAADEVPLTPPPGTVTTAPVPDSIPLLPSPVGGGTGNDRFARGLARLTAIHGDHGLGVMKSLEPICPDLARFIIEYPFGDIYSRPGLDPKSRQIATMASLVTLGHATSELKSHIRGSLNIGLTRTEIIELILQMSVYAGFPASINAMRAAQEVFEQLDNGRG